MFDSAPRMTALLHHLGRLGGVLVDPRQTLEALLFEAEGNVLELVPWMVLITASVAPFDTGQAALLFRTSAVDGIRMFLGAMSLRMSPALLFMFASATALFVLGRIRAREARSAKRILYAHAIDAAAFALVPYFFMTSLGSVFSAAGFDLWFMPHRVLQGRGFHLVLRLVTAYGWSALLVCILLSSAWRGGGRAKVEGRGVGEPHG